MSTQRSKRARRFEKEAVFAGLPLKIQHPSHVPARDRKFAGGVAERRRKHERAVFH